MNNESKRKLCRSVVVSLLFIAVSITIALSFFACKTDYSYPVEPAPEKWDDVLTSSTWVNPSISISDNEIPSFMKNISSIEFEEDSLSPGIFVATITYVEEPDSFTEYGTLTLNGNTGCFSLILPDSSILEFNVTLSSDILHLSYNNSYVYLHK